MKAKILDHPGKPQQQQPRLEDTPQYKAALAQANADLLGTAIGDLGDAKAKLMLYEQSVRQLQVQLAQSQQQQKPEVKPPPPAEPKELEKLRRQVEAETRERQAIETQLREIRKKANDAETLRKTCDHLRHELDTAHADRNAALALIIRIREAAGDPDGKLMQDDLVAHIGKLAAAQKKPRKKASKK